MREIIKGSLYTANRAELRDVPSLLAAGFDAIVDIALEEPPIVFPRDTVYCRIPLLDGSGNTDSILWLAVESVTILIRQGLKTLISCSNGLSRSVVIGIAVYYRIHSLGLDKAIKKVLAQGPADLSPALWNDVRRLLQSEH